MRVIWKYQTVFGPERSILMPSPKTAKLVHFGFDGFGALCLWVEVDTDKPTSNFFYEVFPTGIQLPKDHVHRGSALEEPGGYIWHLYVPTSQ